LVNGHDRFDNDGIRTGGHVNSTASGPTHINRCCEEGRSGGAAAGCLEDRRDSSGAVGCGNTLSGLQSRREPFGLRYAQGQKESIVLDGQAGEAFDGVSAAVFSPDGKRVVYRADW